MSKLLVPGSPLTFLQSICKVAQLGIYSSLGHGGLVMSLFEVPMYMVLVTEANITRW